MTLKVAKGKEWSDDYTVLWRCSDSSTVRSLMLRLTTEFHLKVVQAEEDPDALHCETTWTGVLEWLGATFRTRHSARHLRLFSERASRQERPRHSKWSKGKNVATTLYGGDAVRGHAEKGAKAV